MASVSQQGRLMPPLKPCSPEDIDSFAALDLALRSHPELAREGGKVLNAEALARLVDGIRNFQDAHLGRQSKSMHWPLVRIPDDVFRDRSRSGPLFTALLSAYRQKSNSSWRAFDFASPKRYDDNVAILRRMERDLTAAGFLRRPAIYMDETVPKERRVKLGRIVEKFGGTVVTDPSNASHVVALDPEVDLEDLILEEDRRDKEGQDPEKLYLRTVTIVDPAAEGATGGTDGESVAMVHWWYWPPSYDEWMPATDVSPVVEAEAQRPPGLPWVVSYKFIRDVARHNEWGLEADYAIPDFQTKVELYKTSEAKVEVKGKKGIRSSASGKKGSKGSAKTDPPSHLSAETSRIPQMPLGSASLAAKSPGTPSGGITSSGRRDRRAGIGMNPRQIITGFYGPSGNRIRRTVHDGALRVPLHASTTVHGAMEEIVSGWDDDDKNSVLKKSSQGQAHELPSVDSVTRPSMDGSSGPTLLVTDLIVSSPSGVTIARNRRVPVILPQDDKIERIRGGGDDITGTKDEDTKDVTEAPGGSNSNDTTVTIGEDAANVTEAPGGDNNNETAGTTGKDIMDVTEAPGGGNNDTTGTKDEDMADATEVPGGNNNARDDSKITSIDSVANGPASEIQPPVQNDSSEQNPHSGGMKPSGSETQLSLQNDTSQNNLNSGTPKPSGSEMQTSVEKNTGEENIHNAGLKPSGSEIQPSVENKSSEKPQTGTLNPSPSDAQTSVKNDIIEKGRQTEGPDSSAPGSTDITSPPPVAITESMTAKPSSELMSAPSKVSATAPFIQTDLAASSELKQEPNRSVESNASRKEKTAESQSMPPSTISSAEGTKIDSSAGISSAATEVQEKTAESQSLPPSTSSSAKGTEKDASAGISSGTTGESQASGAAASSLPERNINLKSTGATDHLAEEGGGSSNPEPRSSAPVPTPVPPSATTSTAKSSTVSTPSLPTVMPLVNNPAQQATTALTVSHTSSSTAAAAAGKAHGLKVDTSSSVEETQASAEKPPWYDSRGDSNFERVMLPEWFNESAPHRTPSTYVNARERIIDIARRAQNKYITATAIRRCVPGDAGSLLRLHEFLTNWGFINKNATGESVPTAVDLRRPQISSANKKRPAEKCSWSEHHRELLAKAVAKQATKRRKIDPNAMSDSPGKDSVSDREEVAIDWSIVASEVGGGVSDSECQKVFLSLSLDNIDAEKSADPVSSSSAAAPTANRGKNRRALKEEILRDLVSEVRPEVVKAATEAALKATGVLADAQKGALLGAVAAQAKETAKDEEDSINRLLLEILDQRMQKLENRVSLLDDVEGMLEAERVALELERRDLYTARCRYWFGGGN